MDKEKLKPGRMIMGRSSDVERTPIAEDIRNILNQMDRMLGIYERLVDAGTSSIVNHKLVCEEHHKL